VTGEDSPETLRERFAAQGADLSRVRLVSRAVSPGTLAPLMRLVVIDPIQAVLDGVALGSASAVRVPLAPLVSLATKAEFSVLAIRHLAKAGGGRAIYRGLGSIDFSAVARSVLRIGEDPERPEGRVLVHVKNSLGPLGPSVEFEIADRLSWLGRSELTAHDLDAKPKGARGRSALDLAEEWLREFLAVRATRPRSRRRPPRSRDRRHDPRARPGEGRRRP
jgi:hypothetical protein